MTRPRKGIEWKRDAKAGFTGVLLFGHINQRYTLSGFSVRLSAQYCGRRSLLSR